MYINVTKMSKFSWNTKHTCVSAGIRACYTMYAMDGFRSMWVCLTRYATIYIYIYYIYIHIIYKYYYYCYIYIYMPVLTRNDDKPPEFSKIFGASDLPNQLSSMSLASCAKASPLGPMAVAACRKSRRWWRNRGYMTLDNGYMTIMGYNGYTIKWNDGYMTLNND
jgi:hypothetical protein